FGGGSSGGPAAPAALRGGLPQDSVFAANVLLQTPGVPLGGDGASVMPGLFGQNGDPLVTAFPVQLATSGSGSSDQGVAGLQQDTNAKVVDAVFANVLGSDLAFGNCVDQLDGPRLGGSNG